MTLSDKIESPTLEKRATSFDVFDTAMTRVVGSADSVFLMLGKRLSQRSLIAVSPETFARARSRAEFQALKNLGEVTMADIYAEVQRSLGLTREQCEALIEEEYAVEGDLLRPVPIIRKAIQAARAEGRKILFISDMHKTSAFIRNQLERRGLWQSGDSCYVSCEVGTSKGLGGLFKHVLREEGLSPSNLFHTGDNLHSDVFSAQRLGIRAKHFPEGLLNRYESLLESESWATNCLSAVMAGASRLTRLSMPAASAGEAALRDVAAGVMAPVLAGYVLFVLQRARALGLKRLYFVSRDGQILLRIARRLVEKLSIACELRYLHGSRLSWNQPTLENLDETWIWSPLKDRCSVSRLLDRLNVKPDEVREELLEAGFAEKDWTGVLPPKRVRELRRFLEVETVKQLVFRKASEQRTVLLDYFKQEGLLDSTPKGLVDLGWSGSLSKALLRAVNTSRATPIQFFYYGVTNASLVGLDNLEAYAYDFRRNLGDLRLIEQKNPLLELFCSADHGTVIRFRREAGQVHPVLEQERNQPVLNWGLEQVWETVDSFMEHLCLDRDLINLQADLRPVSEKLMRAFLLEPSRAEARAWGGIPWEEHVSSEGSVSYPWAKPLNLLQLLKACTRFTVPGHFQYAWMGGSIAMSPYPIAKIITGYLWAKSKFDPYRSRLKRRLLRLLGRTP